MGFKKVLIFLLIFSLLSIIILEILYLNKKSQIDKKTTLSNQPTKLDNTLTDNNSGYKTWKGFFVSKTQSLNGFKEIKSEGTKIFGYTTDGQKFLITIRGTISNLDRVNKSLIISQNNDSEKILLSDIDSIQFISKINIAANPSSNIVDPKSSKSQPPMGTFITFDDPRLIVGDYAVFNPKRDDRINSILLVSSSNQL